MNSYFSTYISGFGEVVESLLKKKLSSLYIKRVLDGLVVFDSLASQLHIKDLRFLNNSFILLKFNENVSIEEFVSEILKLGWTKTNLRSTVLKNVSTFRVVYSLENKISKLAEKNLEKLETLISKVLVLKVKRDNPDTEFWILERSEGVILFGLRITKRENESNFEKGELKPELANILCEISEPLDTDIFLDPFAGLGAIPIERAKIAKFKKIFAGENNKDIYKNLLEKTKKLGLSITVGRWNSTKLGALSDRSVNKIVTDPPWGEYSITNVEDLYAKSLQEMDRVLMPTGILVLLTSQKELIKKLLSHHGKKFVLEQQFNILVSGKESGVFKIRKVNWLLG